MHYFFISDAICGKVFSILCSCDGEQVVLSADKTDVAPVALDVAFAPRRRPGRFGRMMCYCDIYLVYLYSKTSVQLFP